MKDALDKLDLRILTILQTDARITNQALANKVGLSPSSCLQRVKQLEKKGYITAYISELDLGKICHYILCIANVKMDNYTPQDVDDFVDLIKKIPEIVECYTVSGECDFILKIICSDMSKHLELNNLLLNSNSKISNIKTHVVMKENKTFEGFPLENLSNTPLQK